MHRYSLRAKNMHRLQPIHQYSHHRIFHRKFSNFTRTPCGLHIQTDLPPNFNKILIANRGEIACRIIRTCQNIGVKTVAVYSDADENSKFVKMADESYRIGPPKSTESYLKMSTLIEVAKHSSAEAIHPGYGFLSENADFVRLCDANGIKFIGPPVNAMEDMGLKSKAKSIMSASNVPITPGYHGDDQSLDKFKDESIKIGYPVMLKAIAGGGGKGIRIVLNESQLETQYNACKAEAIASFNNGNLLVEKYVKHARHIEFQVFTDNHGNGVHLFERDCSVQRDNQKIFEESPAVGLSNELRYKMGASAVNAALAVQYSGAGTVEFLVDPDTMEYYFMEMNTRLQVEHPVTECIVKRDLVQWQLHVAKGHPLPCSQNDIFMNGHAIESRIYAESYNPEYRTFMASAGTLHHLRFCNMNGGNVRVESGVEEGDVVTQYYDAMISKLITYGPDRASALKLMNDCLEQFEVAGLQTNIEFLKTALNHNAFVKGGVTTDFIPTHEDDLFPETDGSDDVSAEAIGLSGMAYLMCFNADLDNKELIGYRVNGSVYQSNIGCNVRLFNGKNQDIGYDVFVKKSGSNNGGYAVYAGNKRMKLDEMRMEFGGNNNKNSNVLIARMNGEYLKCNVCFFDNKMTIFYKTKRYDFVHTKPIKLDNSPKFGKVKGGIGILPPPDRTSPVLEHKSPMQSKLHSLNVKLNDQVSEGDLLGSVEAMKQMYEVWALCDGVVTEINANVDDSLEEDQCILFVQRKEKNKKETKQAKEEQASAN